jgi:hypothetical protein
MRKSVLALSVAAAWSAIALQRAHADQHGPAKHDGGDGAAGGGHQRLVAEPDPRQPEGHGGDQQPKAPNEASHGGLLT